MGKPDLAHISTSWWPVEIRLLQRLIDLVKDLPRIPRIFVLVGLVLLLGALGNRAFLPIGATLIFLGWTVNYGSQGIFWRCHAPGHDWCDDHDYDGQRHFHFGEAVVPFVLCLN